ncbi:MAG: hypothetical protein GY904_24240 [Planctomycetaceae bacterium]|nr:hypothetical protein [Planctomycetaceae bacterium]
MFHRYQSAIALLGCLCLITGCSDLTAENPGSEDLVADVVNLAAPEIAESSGLAASWRKEDHFWTHNDSGDQARLFAFNTKGRLTRTLQFSTLQAEDWEDMASFVDGDVPRLLIADCGDNQRNRSSVTLYLMDEPAPDHEHSVDPKNLTTLSVVYPDGARDCEAVAVDPKRRKIVLVTKSFLPAVGAYTIPLPPRPEGDQAVRQQVTAKRIATLAIPMVTAMDLNQRSGDLWLASYFQAFCFSCKDREQKFSDQFSALPKPIELPRWRQIEAFAVDPSEQLWLTSEGSPTPLGRIIHRSEN